jgi:hypothetical protein
MPLRPYTPSVLSWMKPGTKPPYPYAFRSWGAARPYLFAPWDMGPSPYIIRPSPGRRAVTACGVFSNSLVNQDWFEIILAEAGGSPSPFKIEYEVDGGGFSGTAQIEVSVLSTDTATQVRDKTLAAMLAAGSLWQYCYARDIAPGDAYKDIYHMPDAPYIMIVDPNKGPLENENTTQYRTHITQTVTHGSIVGAIGSGDYFLVYAGEYEVLGLCARWGFNRAILPGLRAEPEQPLGE